MTAVRDKLPVRRDAPSQTPNEGNWTVHKPDLREDFHEHCGYCGSYDGFRHTWFEVDHFIPKSFLLLTGNISNVEYSNLVYSCKFCNNKKLSKWPSKSETVFHINNEGFVDPCDVDFDNHLHRANDGSIMWSTPLGKWMVTEAFRFDERQDSIKVLWNLNETRKVIDSLIELMSQEVEGSQEYDIIKSKAEEYSLKYYIFHKELINFYNE